RRGWNIKSSISHVKTIVMTLLAATLSCASFAAPTFRDAGPTLTDGASSSHWTALYATRNPAGAEFSISPESKIRMGVLSSLGIGVEVGPVDDFVDEIDSLIEQLDRDDISLAEGQALVQRFNALRGTVAGWVRQGARGSTCSVLSHAHPQQEGSRHAECQFRRLGSSRAARCSRHL